MASKLYYFLVICNVFSSIIIVFCLFLSVSMADAFNYLFNATIISPCGKKSGYCTDLGLMIIIQLLSSS